VLAVAAALLLFVTPAPADTVGVASVIDGDTIEIHGERIRLDGIDAPEDGQTCLDAAGPNWRCGQRAALALQDLIGRRTVTCDERDLDRYGRIVGRCLVGDLDINEWLLARAWRWHTGIAPVTTSRLRIRPHRPAAACGPARSSRRGSGGADTDDRNRPAVHRTRACGLASMRRKPSHG
jgi:endonuclease YncB( thermonuclease family)